MRPYMAFEYWRNCSNGITTHLWDIKYRFTKLIIWSRINQAGKHEDDTIIIKICQVFLESDRDISFELNSFVDREDMNESCNNIYRESAVIMMMISEIENN